MQLNKTQRQQQAAAIKQATETYTIHMDTSKDKFQYRVYKNKELVSDFNNYQSASNYLLQLQLKLICELIAINTTSANIKQAINDCPGFESQLALLRYWATPPKPPAEPPTLEEYQAACE